MTFDYLNYNAFLQYERIGDTYYILHVMHASTFGTARLFECGVPVNPLTVGNIVS